MVACVYEYRFLIEQVKDDETALMVCDSPYTKKQMGSKAIYECELSEEDQWRYIRLVYDSSAKVLVCGYDNEIYNEVLFQTIGTHQWYEYAVGEVPKSMGWVEMGGSKSRATEMIWTNWKAL